jgi:2-dehydropantoate 2-reductase
MIPKIELAVDEDILKNRLIELADILRDSGLEVQILKSQSQVLWNKLLRLNVIASFTAAYQKTIGEIRKDPAHRYEMKDFIKESLLVAAQDDYHGDLKHIFNQIEDLPFDLMTSLQKDIKAGKLSELESITGGIIKQGIKNNIDLPMHLLIYNKIKSQLKEYDDEY